MEKEELWYRVLKARYGEEGGRLKEGGSHCSAWWRSLTMICDGVGEGVGDWFDNNISRVVGNGRGTSFWHDIWVGEIPLKFKFPRLFELSVDKECSVEEMRTRLWAVVGRERMWHRRLLAWEYESVRKCLVLLHNIVL